METESTQQTSRENGGPVLEVRNLTKRFGATLALNRVSLELRGGEVLALLGDNGAGKSTLIKCLSGVHEPDEGEILIEGKNVHIDSPMRARGLGVETVYQDLALFDNMSVVGNFYAGREPTRPRWLGNWGWVQDNDMAKEANDLIDSLEVNLPGADMEIGLMSGGQRQAVASARAMAFGRKIVILDEPTSALGARESGNVLRLIQEAPQQGVSVIVISHNLEHVMQVAHRAVVMRQGRVVGEEEPTPENHERLVSLIVGSTEGEDEAQQDDPGNNERQAGE
ncbi:MAG: ATP-binding cassette domain-containing protein [Rubrobacter sp.]